MKDEGRSFIDLLTDGKVKAITFDMEISTDNVKFSGWLATLSTGALALVTANLSKILEKPLLGGFCFITLLAGVGFITVSIITAAVINWNFNTDCSVKRQLMTLALKQRIILVMDNDEVNSRSRLWRSVTERRLSRR